MILGFNFVIAINLAKGEVNKALNQSNQLFCKTIHYFEALEIPHAGDT